jgi:hypothetical protein
MGAYAHVGLSKMGTVLLGEWTIEMGFLELANEGWIVVLPCCTPCFSLGNRKSHDA